jgi:outer membrane protein assembly factor BamD
MSKITQALVLVLLALCLSNCSSNKDKDGPERGSEQDTYEAARRQLDSQNWESAIETLELLEEYFPFGKYAEQAQLEIIYAYYRSGEHQAAIASADRFVRLHPQHRNVDYAVYMRGIANYYNDSVFNAMLFGSDFTLRDIGTAKEAYNDFTQLINEYPESSYAIDAQKRLVFLRNTIARSEINVANYYFKREAFMAAANRGRWVVEHMQGTPSVPDGLAVMAQAYHLLGMQKLSDDAVSVLELNYPDHPSFKKGKFEYQSVRKDKKTWASRLTLGLFDKQPSIAFDSREQYNPLYQDAADIAEPPR